MSLIRRFRNIRIAYAIVLIALLPSVVAIFFAAQVVMEEDERAEKAQVVSDITELALRLNDLVHELQKERGASAGFLGSQGMRFGEELQQQRHKTQLQQQALQAYLQAVDMARFGAAFSSKVQKTLDDLDQLPEIRSQVDQLSLSEQAAISYYSNLNGNKIDAISYMAEVSPEVRLATRLLAYSRFLLAKENAGIERAIGAGQIAAGQFSPRSLAHFTKLAHIQESYLNTFLAYASASAVALFNRMLAQSEVAEVQRIRDQIYANGLAGELEGIDGVYWFDIMTQKINGLKQVEDFLTAELTNEARIILKAANEARVQSILLVATVVLVTVMLSVLLVLSVNTSVERIVAATVKLSQGDLQVELPKKFDNEIGQFISALEIFRDNALEQQRLKLALQNHKAELEHEVKRQTHDLQELNAELEEFTYRTSHDLRSPIVSAIKLLEIGERSLAAGKEVQATQSMRLAVEGLAKLEGLTLDILAIARAKKLDEEAVPVDLAQVVQDTRSKLSHMQGYETLHWDIELEQVPVLQVKASRLVMIVENLISNAIKYRDPKEAQSYVRISAQLEGQHLAFVVEDNGLGIPKDQQQHLFAMFKRFHPKVSFGSGLGLYLMKKSADILNGKIEFDDLGKGSMFRLIIPVS